MYEIKEIMDIMKELAEESADIREGMAYYEDADEEEKTLLENMILTCVNSDLFEGMPLKTRVKLFCLTNPNDYQ